MTKTESEWQELSDLLAREVMSWHTEGTVWWYDIGRTVKDGGISIDGKIMAHSKPMAPWPWPPSPLYQYKIWSPHNDVTQAMLILRTLLAKAGQYAVARISIRPPPGHCLVTIHNWVATAGAPALFVRSPYVDNEMQAICLAAKEWCNAFTRQGN